MKTGKPRHEQLSDWLREQIEQKAYAPNDQLPSESELEKKFKISRITIRRALQTLENEGLIYRRQGLGSFVKTNRVHQGLVRLTDFVEDMQNAGLEPSSQVISFEATTPTATVRKHLGVEEGIQVFRLDRLRLADGEPIAFDRTWLTGFYAQLLQSHDLAHETIYHILESMYQIPVISGKYRIEAVNADKVIANHLSIPEKTALLLIERLSCSIGDKKIYFQQRYYRSDRVAYELILERGIDHTQSLKAGLPLRDFEPVFKKAED